MEGKVSRIIGAVVDIEFENTPAPKIHDAIKVPMEDGRTIWLETAKLLLDAGGYGPAARLQGIYHTAFSDQADIPDGLLGYAALAQGLGMVRGDGSGRLNPNRTATRGEAAVMLYAFMGRAS